MAQHRSSFFIWCELEEQFMKRLLSLILCIAMLLSFAPLSVISADSILFESDFDVNSLKECAMKFSEDNADFEIIQYAGSKKLSVNTAIDGVLAVASATVKSDIAGYVTISEEFIQKDVKNDGNVIMSFNNGANNLLSVETYEGDIVYKKKDGSYLSIVDNYLANMSYDIKVEMNFTAKNADVYVNGECVLDAIDLRTTDYSTSSKNAFIISTKYSPGFLIDDLKIYGGTVNENILIAGNTEVSIPQNGELEYLYKIENTDSEIRWYLKENVFGVGVAAGENNGEAILRVTSAVPSECTVILCAELADDPSVYARFAIKLFYQKAETILISGPSKITYSKELNEFKYAVQAVDSHGNPYIDQNIVTEIKARDEEIPSSVTFDSESLTINTVGDVPKDKQFLMVSYLRNMPEIKCEKIITMEDFETYMADEYRMNVVKTASDTIIEKGTDNYRFTPLIPDFIEIETSGKAIATSPSSDRLTPNKDYVTSNLASQGNFMRTFEALTKLTGDEKYQRKVDDVYDYWLNNGMSDYGVPYWGGHMAINMIDGTPVYAPDNIYTSELKDFGPYYEPFYRLDPEKAEKIVSSTYALHISDWNTLCFNRHGVFNEEHDWNMWYTPEKYEYENVGLIVSPFIPFRSAGNDFIYAAMKCYEQLNDPSSLTWALRILQRYYDVEHIETRLGGYQFTTAYALDPDKEYTDPTNDPMITHPGKQIKNPWLTLEPLGHWYDVSPWSQYRVEYTGSSYGDRVFNQYADDLIEQGYFTEEEKYMIREANFSVGSYSLSERAFVETDFAETIKETNPEDSKKILWDLLWATGTLIEKAYNSYNNSFKRIVYDGRTLNGFKVNRNGYNSTKGVVMTSSEPDPDFYAAAIKIYLATKDIAREGYTRQIAGKDMSVYTDIDKQTLLDAGYVRTADGGYEKTFTPEELEEQRSRIWKCIQNIAKAYGYGNLGNIETGEDMNLNYYTIKDKPIDIMAFVWLYEATGEVKYLDMARVIAGNMIENYFYNGYFVESKDNRYATIGFEMGGYGYSLLLLEAAIRGEFEQYPEFYNATGNFDCNFVDPVTGAYTTSNSAFRNKKATKVLTTKIIVDNDNISLKSGENKKLLVTVEPDDASNKTINWNNLNSKVARIDPETKIIYAISPGTTVLYGISDDKKSKINITVTVTE